MRTTVWLAVRCSRMNAITSALVMRSGVLSTTEKNTFRWNATASRVLGRARAVRNCKVLIDQRVTDAHLQLSAGTNGTADAWLPTHG